MRIRMIWSMVLLTAALTAACGDSTSSLTPTAPSALSADAASVGATDEDVSGPTGNGPKPGNGNGNGNNGGGNGNGNGNGNRPRTPTNTSPNPPAPVPPGKSKVEFEGLVQAVSSDSILVNGQVIMVTSDTVIRHGNRMFDLLDLNAGDRVHVRANRVAPPTTAVGVTAEATLQATIILLQNPGDEDDDDGETDALVSVAAPDASAVEMGTNTGTFRLTRTGTPAQLALPLTVSFTLGGTATNGSDYTAPLTATFPAGEATVDIVITPTADGLAEVSETVILALSDVTPYELGSPLTATVTITDVAAVPLSAVTAAFGALSAH